MRITTICEFPFLKLQGINHFIVISPCSFVQSTLIVAFEYSRAKTVEFGAVSAHVPIGVPL